MYDNFWFDGDFPVQNLDASVELRQYQSLSHFFRNRMVLFLSSLGLFFEPQDERLPRKSPQGIR